MKEETANHTWNSGSVTKQPTGKEEGVKTYTCTACNETKTESIAKLTTHTYDHTCDTNCNVCGATRTITHNYKTSWSKDKTNHWHVCSGCGLKQDDAAHEPGAEATSTTTQTCTVCSYEITPALGNAETQVPSDSTDITTSITSSESTDSTTPTTPNENKESEDENFPWLSIIIVAVAVGSVMAVIIIKKKK